MEKIDKIYHKIKETEDEDEKNILINYFIRKYKNLNTTESEDKYQEITSNYKKVDPILNMIKKEKFSKLKEIISKVRIKWENYLNKKETPLHLAIENGDTRVIKLLLENSYPIWLPNKKNLSGLELACLRKDVLMIENFLKYNADIKKILYFRENNKHFHYNDFNLDFMILAKKILIENNYKENLRDNKNPKFIGLGNYTWEDFIDSFGIIIKNSYPDLFSWYLEIYNNEKKRFNKLEWLNFWFLFNFSFNISDYNYFYLELDYLEEYLINKGFKDIHKKIEYKFNNDYNKIYSKEFLELVLKLWLNREK